MSGKTLVTASLDKNHCNCYCIFIDQAVLVRKQLKNLLLFESSYHFFTTTIDVLHSPFLLVSVKEESCEYTIFVFGLTRLGIEPQSTVSVADALSTLPLIG